MILTVTLNPCIDHTADVESFTPGATNRVLSSRRDPSGKGVNVSIVLRRLGIRTVCAGVTRAENRGLLEETVEAHHIAHDFVTAPGALRVNLKIFDRAAGVMTECNEKGSPLPPESLGEFLELLDRRLPEARMLVLSGSVPPGVPDDIYKTIGLMARKAGVPVVLDAKGPLLHHGLEARPVLIKPNLDELRETFGVAPQTAAETGTVCRAILRETGLTYLCLSMGAKGALLATRDGVWVTPGSKVEVRGIQGAGDSMVAGLCAGILRCEEPEKLLAGGAAAAQGSVEKPGTLLCEREDYLRFLTKVPVQRLSI